MQYEGGFTDGLCSGVGHYTYKNKEAEQTNNFQVDCKSKSGSTSNGSNMVNFTNQNQ